jgi:tetratricopeptide (TPR) repeat protein
MSPEQIDDPTTCDARSDLYSLGCVLYFLLTGQPPYSEKSLPELLDAHRNSPAPSVHAVLPDVPDNVAAIVNRLLAKQPEARFQSSGELVVAIQAARVQPAPESSRMTTAAVVSPSVLVSPLPPNPHPQRMRRTTVLVVTGVLAIGLCFALWSYSARGGRVPESPDFVQGMSLLDQRQERQVRRAIDKFREVLAHDPRHARAHAALAQAYNLCGDYGWDLPDAAFPKAIESAQRALELNPDLAEGRLALAFASATYKCDWEDAEKQFRLTLKTAPQLAPAHHWYAWFLVQQGRFDEAQQEIEQAHELAADNLIIANNVGKILYFSRRYSEAVDKHRAALDLDQDFQKAHMDLGYALIELDRADEALSEFDQSVGISSMDWDVQAARAYAMARQRDFDSVKPLLQLLESVADKEGLSLEMAHIYGATGDFDRAFHWLDVAFTRKSPGRAGIAVDPRLDPLRSDPRFAPLLKSIGLKQQ